MKMNFAKKATALAMSVLFAVSMAGCGSSASTAKKVEVTSVEDLADLKIGVQTGTTGDSQASDAVNADSQMQRYNKGADAIQALKNGKIDCVVIDSLPAEKFVAANDDLKIVEGIFDTEEYAMCFKKGNELRDEFNTALAELKEDGTLDEIMSNYIGDEVGQHPYESPADVDRSNGTLTMATNAEFPPYEFYDGDKIVGIDAEIAQAIADELGMELEIEDIAFDSIIPEIVSGKADMALAGMTVTEDRKASVDFSDTYATASQMIIVKEDSKIAGPDDLKGVTVGVQLGTTGDIYVSDLEADGTTVERYNKGFEAVQALSQGKIDAVVIDGEPAKTFVSETEGLKILDEAFTVEEYAIAVKKGNTELLDKVNGALETLKDNGTLDEIVAKYIKAE